MAARRVWQTYSVFVGQLDTSVTKAELYELFKGCGEVVDLVIMQDENGIKKNYGFVRYLDAESALKAAEDFHEWPLRGTPLMVDISRDTLTKLQMEKGAFVKKRGLKTNITKESSSNNTTSSCIKDTMYMNRLKDALSSMSLQYTPAQVNYKRLLRDMGPLSTICQTQFAALKEEIPFQEVSAKIMEKCKEHSSKAEGIEKAGEFKKALQIIISEISGVMDIEGITTEKSQEDPDEGKLIFNKHIVPESVRRIQQLEKYTQPANNPISTDFTENFLQSVPTREMCDAECMTDMDDLNVEHDEKVCENNVFDPAILDYHLSTVVQQEQSYDHIVSSPPDDPLEALYLRDFCCNGVQRSSSRDSSLSADSIDDSGIETEVDILRPVPLTAQPEVRYECYRVEGRARPVDHRQVTDSVKSRGVNMGGITRRCDEQFSLEEYISQNVGRGRGAAVYVGTVPQTASRPVGGRGIFKL